MAGTNTFFALMAEYNHAIIGVKDCAEKFGLSPKVAMERANKQALPIPCFRLEESQKAPMYIHVQDLANWIDSRREAANELWKKVNSA